MRSPAVLRRRPEAYHETLRAHEAADPTGAAPADEGGAPASIHDLLLAKEEGLSRLLHYDDNERRSGLVRFLAPDVRAAAFRSPMYAAPNTSAHVAAATRLCEKG